MKARGGLLGAHSVVRGASSRPLPFALSSPLLLRPPHAPTAVRISRCVRGFARCPGHGRAVRQRLLAGTWCLNDREVLSPGQAEEIDRIWAAYPHLRDDQFIAENLDRWMAGGAPPRP